MPRTDECSQPTAASTSPNDLDDQEGHSDGIRGDLINVLRGFCMGAADTVPGVSGGTVALILGHYERLVTAISRFDGNFVRTVGGGQLAAASRHIDLRFLIALGTGIVIGIVTLSGLMHWLLDHRLPETMAVFCGFLIASGWIVRGYIDRWSGSRWVALLAGSAMAVAITALPVAGGSLGLVYLFGSASIAICAMILPGISGAFVLLLLGVYHDVTGLIKNAARGEISLGSMIQIATFAAGCATGLLLFSRLLRWLLDRHHDVTMAGLLGLMVGSVAKLWPLQAPTVATAELEFKFRQIEYFSPSAWPHGGLGIVITLLVVATAGVLVIERIASAGPRR